jgi:protein-tyrosine phosphatase
VQPVRILFVCMGNICRSPTAHAVFRKMVQEEGLTERIWIDSAGTHAYHIGEPPDSRSQQTALRRGIDMGDLRARKVQRGDFSDYHYILAMDQDNLSNLRTLAAQSTAAARVELFLDYADDWSEQEVPDPYYGGAQGFERVFDMVEAASRGLLESLRSRGEI